MVDRLRFLLDNLADYGCDSACCLLGITKLPFPLPRQQGTSNLADHIVI